MGYWLQNSADGDPCTEQSGWTLLLTELCGSAEVPIVRTGKVREEVQRHHQQQRWLCFYNATTYHVTITLYLKKSKEKMEYVGTF